MLDVKKRRQRNEHETNNGLAYSIVSLSKEVICNAYAIIYTTVY